MKNNKINSKYAKIIFLYTLTSLTLVGCIMMFCLNVKCDDEIMTSYTPKLIPELTNYILQMEPPNKKTTNIINFTLGISNSSDSSDSYFSLVYNHICEHKVRILVILGLTILIVGGCYMYPDETINIHYYEPPIVRDAEDVIILEAMNKMSAKEFEAWVREWITKP